MGTRMQRYIWQADEIEVEKPSKHGCYEQHVKRLERKMVGLQAALAKAEREGRPTSALLRSIRSLQARIDLV